jgi:HlyD family secretion protein
VRRVWFWSLPLIALAGGAAYWVYAPQTSDPSAPPYRLGAVDRGAITASVRATGTLNPVTTVLVGSQLSGRVVEILVDFNSPVKAGQVVARLDADQIRARREGAAADLAQAQADVSVKRAQLERARATRKRAEATILDQDAQRRRAVALLDESRRNQERQNELTNRSVGSQTALEAARTQFEVQTAALGSIDAQIAATTAEIAGLDADLGVAEGQIRAAEALVVQRRSKLREIDIDLERAEIRSPVDGVVVQRQVDLGQTVAASLSAPTLFTVAQDLREIDIHANIDEADVGRLSQGQPANFTVNAYPGRTFAGVVRMVRLAAQTVQNVVTYTAVIRVENRDLALLPGMTANLQIITEDRRDVLRVPNAALRFRAVGPNGQPLMGPPEAATASVAAAPAGQRGRAMAELRERLGVEVQPTADQNAAIQKILLDARNDASARDPGLSPEERREAFRRAGQDVSRQVAAVLDPERRAKFEAILVEMRDRRAAPRTAALPGRIYVMGPDGRPQAIALRVGVSDGVVTEIVSGDLAEGASVIVGGGPSPQAAAASETRGAARPRPPRMF